MQMLDILLLILDCQFVVILFNENIFEKVKIASFKALYVLNSKLKPYSFVFIKDLSVLLEVLENQN